MDSIFGVMEAQKHIQFYGVSINIYLYLIIFNLLYEIYFLLNIFNLFYEDYWITFWKYNIALIFFKKYFKDLTRKFFYSIFLFKL